MTEELQRGAFAAGFKLSLTRLLLDITIKPKPRFYSIRESAVGTASYSFILSRVGPIGPHTREQAQKAIIFAGLRMGIVGRDANGNLIRI